MSVILYYILVYTYLISLVTSYFASKLFTLIQSVL